jgi:[acyl-carrier-protein] S-malonyltransferase
VITSIDVSGDADYGLRAIRRRLRNGEPQMSEPTLPSGPVALVFPGQGSQIVGMGKTLAEASPAANAILDETDAILGVPLTELMAGGPAEELEDTINAQPAILAVSVAAWRAMLERLEVPGTQLDVAAVAGHSLGEFSALVAAGALDYPAALSLVRERGRLMKEAGSASPGGMAAVLGLDDEAIATVCQQASETGIVVPANRNCPGQIVISGEIAALEQAMELAKAAGAKRVARLGVSIASHSPLMAEANEAFNAVLDDLDLQDPSIPVIGNVSALPLASAAEIEVELREQMEQPVNWTGTIENLVASGITTFIELGPGNVLSGLIRRIDREATTLSLSALGLGLPDSVADN